MSAIYVFGKEDQLFLPELHTHMSPLGIHALYTHPSYNWCYSKYGFACPLDYETIPLEIAMDGIKTITSPNINLFDFSYNYVFVDHFCHVWRYLVYVEDGKIYRKRFYVYTKPNSWWFANIEDTDKFDNDRLFGFLTTQPTEKKLRQYWSENYHGRDLVKLSIKAIAEKLNTDFPFPKNE